MTEAERNGMEEAVAIAGDLTDSTGSLERVTGAQLNFLFPASRHANKTSEQKSRTIVNVRTRIPHLGWWRTMVVVVVVTVQRIRLFVALLVVGVPSFVAPW